MRRGGAPCCDKSRMVKGPWSPAEDQKLIEFVQKHGHDNWRHLPRLAGLSRCGKSARLRWVNYLKPDVKRGNFSQEEEDTIIQLQKTMGNKWSKIASLLKGRTDNEIKNYWNTHLKKRQAKRAAEDITTETSVITSSSSSSDIIESKSKSQKSEIESQFKLLVQEDNAKKTDETGFTMMELALAPSHQSPVVNHVPEVCESFNNVVPISQQSEKLLNSSSIDQLEKIIISDDTDLLESLLTEVDDSNWPMENESTGSNSLCVLPIECDFSFWGMLDNDVIQAPTKDDQTELNYAHNVESPIIEISMNDYLIDFVADQDINNMFEYSPNESGLPQQSVEVCSKQVQHQQEDVNSSNW